MLTAATAPERHGAVAGTARWSRRVVADVVSLLDVAAVSLAAYAALITHNVAGIEVTLQPLVMIEYGLLLGAATHYCLKQLGHYEPERVARLGWQPLELLAGTFIAFSMLTAVAFTLGQAETMPRTWFPVWWAFAFLTISLERLVVGRQLASAIAAGKFDSNVAVYGAGRIALKLRDYVARRGSGVHLVGVYEDRQDPARLGDFPMPIVGRLADLIEDGRAGLIDEIIIALPQSADQRITEIARRLEQLPVRIRVCTHIASDLFAVDDTRHRVSSIGPLGLLDVKLKPLADWAPIVKRVEDLLIGTIALVVLAPVMALVALAIKLDSPGPVLFRQKRHGLNHRVIEVLKFRSMRVQEDGATVRQATRDDPRVTRVGWFLRRSSLDELPQLINVLRGEMSLVGPRPHALVHNEQFGEMLERYANRHQVKPGITGWAQINGFRGETQTPADMQGRVEHDLHYIDHWSIWLDLRIIALTPLCGLAHRNAY